MKEMRGISESMYKVGDVTKEIMEVIKSQKRDAI